MSRLIIASNNVHKIDEIRTILTKNQIDLTVLSLKDLSEPFDIAEDGTTFEENASKKAQTIARAYPQDFVLADDSGLVISALNGEPGVYSARYAGDHDDQANIDKVLTKLQGIDASQRQAYFTTVMVLVGPQRDKLVTEGRAEGVVTTAPRGANGFGYDPIFELPSFGQTMAEISAAQKNSISHRGRALSSLVAQLPQWLEEGK